VFFSKGQQSRFDLVKKQLNAASVVDGVEGWRITAEFTVGGLSAVGFFTTDSTPQLDRLIAVGSRGQTIVDCRSGEVVYRNRDHDGYDPDTLTAWDLSGSCEEPVRMTGLEGGGLKTCTKDGWSVEAIPAGWPIYHYVLQQPGSSILIDIDAKRKPRFVLLDYDYLAMAWGFSPSGNSLLLTNSGDIRIWTRASVGS